MRALPQRNGTPGRTEAQKRALVTAERGDECANKHCRDAKRRGAQDSRAIVRSLLAILKRQKRARLGVGLVSPICLFKNGNLDFEQVRTLLNIANAKQRPF